MDSATKLQQRSGEHFVTSLRVEVADGPDRGAHATCTDALSVGTAKDNALAVTDFTVSRFHLEVSVRPNGI
ncbi:MAG: hypothetical protein JWO36_3633, partial [Myxococcales bacterium]|nr:hypothetical protein [Myxococcales bacterium]